jgi:hypothetical protein
LSITTQLALFLVGQEAIRRRCEGAMKKQKRVWAEQLPQRDATCEDSAIDLDLIEVSSGDSSMMSQPGFGIGCSTAFAKLPLRSASDDEASVRKIQESPSTEFCLFVDSPGHMLFRRSFYTRCRQRCPVWGASFANRVFRSAACWHCCDLLVPLADTIVRWQW